MTKIEDNIVLVNTHFDLNLAAYLYLLAACINDETCILAATIHDCHHTTDELMQLLYSFDP
jgi:hypothetical protein